MPKAGCDPVGSLCWSRLLQGPVDPWGEETTLEQLVSEELHPVEGTHVGAVHGGRSPRGRTSHWSRGRV